MLMERLQKMEVTARRLIDWNTVLNAARFTVNLEDSDTSEPSEKFKREILLAEHSPIRTLVYEITMKGIPSWVSQHIARHDAFAMHTVREGAADTHFVATQRSDRTGVDRNKLPQDAPVDHRMVLNAQDLITISRKRLCACASIETRALWQKVRDTVSKLDPEVADMMVRECVYRGFCTEKRRNCGYVRTAKFRRERDQYKGNND